MKLVTYRHRERERLGLLDGSTVVDLAQAHAAFEDDAGTTASLPASVFPTDTVTFLRGGEAMWKATTATLEWLRSRGLTPAESSFLFDRSDVRLGPPVRMPGKIVCVGLNYHDHCREQELDVPTSPILFAKFPSSIIGPEDEISWPADASREVDYEAELAVVIGRTARNVAVDDAGDYVAGYTIVNDVSARDVQFADGQWVRGKSFDTFCPMGPYLATPDEVGDPHTLDIRCRLNGEMVQDSNTKELIFDIPTLIAFISRTCTLLPGDIIITGTPAGVGVFREPPIFLQSGDVVEIEIEALGRLRNPVA